MVDLLSQLELFWTELSPTRGVVYARLIGEAYRSDWRLEGSVRGPRSLWHQTLAETTPLVDLGLGPTNLARAVIAEPSFWSPDAPNLYDMTVRLTCGNEPPHTITRTLGLRSLVAGPRYLVREGKTWIPRGIFAADLQTIDLPAISNLGAVLVVESPEETLLRDASEQGVYLAVRLSGDERAIRDRLRKLVRWPAVAMVLLEGNGLTDDPRQCAPNVIFMQDARDDTAFAPADWSHAVLLKDDPIILQPAVQSSGRPIFVARRLPEPTDVGTARAACDVLQRDLAPVGQFAGYFV